MGKASAVDFSLAGDQFLGKSYSVMDCQKFVENCMREVGITLDLPGSNTWYRKMTWVGSPEECVKRFGSVPKGALLYILEQDGKEPDKYKPDGIGNVSHIGIKTGRGKGAIHSSASRGGVVESFFDDATIHNGGWNRVGLWDQFTYGDKIDRLLSGDSSGEPEEPESEIIMAKVYSENGLPVKMRQSKKEGTTAYGLYEEYPVGTDVEVLESGEKWSHVRIGGRTGYMMSKFIDASGDSHVPVPDPTTGEGDITLTITAEEAQVLLPILDKITAQLVDLVGRG